MGFTFSALAQAPVILVAHPTNDQFLKAKKGLEEEIGQDFVVESLKVTSGTTLEDFTAAIERVKPNLIVIMDARPLGLYRLYQDNLPASQEPVPALVLMSLYLDKQLSNIKNATGILYEIPGLLTITQLRPLFQIPVERVGVVYRAGLREFFQTQKALCAKWEIDLIGYEIPERSQNYSRHIRRGLRNLLKEEKVDALWVINDTALLNNYLLSRAWLPVIKRYDTPVVVSVPQLITEAAPIGHLAVVPDSFELGVQAGDLVLQIQAEGWQARQIEIQKPISVRKLLNLNRLDGSIPINDDAILEMDHVSGMSSEND
jgi:hypothetical protein